MRSLSFIALILCSLALACSRDTEHRQQGACTLEPRLTGDPVRTGANVACDVTPTSRDAAVSMLLNQPECIDVAVDALKLLSERDANAMSDLAAAYYIRGRECVGAAAPGVPEGGSAHTGCKQRPSDYLAAYEAAEHAVNSARTPAALLNRALIEEALGFPPSWDEAINSEDSRWSDAARDYRACRRNDAAKQRPLDLAPLMAAVRDGDHATAARLIRQSPVEAERALQGLLNAAAGNTGDVTRDDVRRLAGEIAGITASRFAASIATTDGPWDLAARLQAAVRLSREPVGNAMARAASAIEPVERAARMSGSQRLALDAQVVHAFFCIFTARFMESLDEYTDAMAAYARLGDLAAYTDTRMRRISAFRALGEHEMAWREAFALIPDIWRLSGVSKHLLLNEAAIAASELGFQTAALRYAELDVHASTPLPDERALVTAYRTRAGIECSLGATGAAEDDLNAATTLLKNFDGNQERILRARIDAVRGESLLRRAKPLQAVAALTAAIQATSAEMPTLQAQLHAQRAEARFAARQDDLAETDLVQSLALLEGEQRGVLEARAPGQHEDDWSAYFSRFRSTFGRLIQYLIDRGRSEDAFKYAEDAKGVEPLNLVMRPQEADAIGIAQIRAALPPRTVMLEYALLGDRAVVWILSRDRFESVPVPVSQANVERWSAQLRERPDTADTVLHAAFRLLEAPLARIHEPVDELIIIPDGPMHGLPFPALRDANDRYLIERFAVSTDGSAKLYLFASQRDRQLASSPNTEALLVANSAGNPASPLTSGLRRLLFARSEIEDIAKLYPGARLLSDKQATIPRFLELAPRSAIIHIAAHGIPNPAQPSHSFIALAPSENDSGALDGNVLMRTHKLDNARLVVLSACSSAGGLPIGPEGVAPLVRPLIAAGVPAVVGTLWDVNDATAKDLLVSFHRAYRAGQDAAAAMRAAQVQMLRGAKDDDQRLPAWAAFEVIGHSSSPFAAAPRHN